MTRLFVRSPARHFEGTQSESLKREKSPKSQIGEKKRSKVEKVGLAASSSTFWNRRVQWNRARLLMALHHVTSSTSRQVPLNYSPSSLIADFGRVLCSAFQQSN
jgi:hypothetical protein